MFVPYSARRPCLAIDVSKAFDMVNHTKLISALILSPLSNNTKLWLSAYLKSAQPAANITSIYPILLSMYEIDKASCQRPSEAPPILYIKHVSKYWNETDFLVS